MYAYTHVHTHIIHITALAFVLCTVLFCLETRLKNGANFLIMKHVYFYEFCIAIPTFVYSTVLFHII